jgi:transposase
VVGHVKGLGAALVVLDATSGYEMALACALQAAGKSGRLTRREVSALAGLAPIPRDSGQYRGKRSIHGGRPELHKALYMADLLGTRGNPVLEAFYKRSVGAGKPNKVALVASMRKLLTVPNAMVRNRKPWDDALHSA